MEIEKIKIFREKIRHIEIEIANQLKDDRACLGISLSQCHALLEIGGKGKTSLVELASSLRLDPSTLSRTIDGLVNIGLVHRNQNPNDRRYISLTLSEQGKRLYHTIEEFYNRYFTQLFNFIPEEKHEQVIESFTLFSEAAKKCKIATSCCQDEGKDEGK